MIKLKQLLTEKKELDAKTIDRTGIFVEFLILKRKIAKKSDFPISRLQRFEPSQGKISMNKTSNSFSFFFTFS